MIYFTTTNPEALLDAFDAAIAVKTITTWDGSKGGAYGHLAPRWAHKALVFGRVETGLLRFYFTCVTGNVPVQSERRAVFAYYQAHLLETFTNHFGSRYSTATASAVPTPPDSAF